MKVRSTLLGLAVLAVLAAGAWWARMPSAPAGTTPAAAKPAPGDDDLPDVTLADRIADVGEVRITLSVTPNPPVALARFRVRVRAESAGSVVSLEGARVSFEMTMPMGDHRYKLIPGSDGWLEAAVVLPTCPSGKRRWYATIEGTVAGRPRSVRFRLDLAPPPSLP